MNDDKAAEIKAKIAKYNEVIADAKELINGKIDIIFATGQVLAILELQLKSAES